MAGNITGFGLFSLFPFKMIFLVVSKGYKLKFIALFSEGK